MASARRVRGKGALGILFAPVTLLILFFLLPLLIMVQMSVVQFPPNVDSGYTLSHYTEVLTNPLNPHIAWTTFTIATTAMAIMLADRDAARLLHGVQGEEVGAVPVAVARVGGRVGAGRQGVRLAGDPGPERHPQLG